MGTQINQQFYGYLIFGLGLVFLSIMHSTIEQGKEQNVHLKLLYLQIFGCIGLAFSQEPEECIGGK